METKTKPAGPTAGNETLESLKTHVCDEAKVEDSADNIDDFPIFFLPKPMREFIEDANRTLNFPKAYMAMSMLSAIAVAIGNTRYVHINTGFDCKPIIYMTLIGPPGANKSHPLNMAFQPLVEYSNELFQKSHEECKSEDSFVPETIILKDYTMEAMYEIHEKNPRRICLFHDELATLFGQMNKYKSGADEQLFIQLFEGKAFTSSRKTGVKKHIFIPETCPVIVSTSQPEIFNSLFKGKNIDNGLYYRFLQVRTPDTVRSYWSSQEFPPRHMDWWKDVLLTIIRRCDDDAGIFNVNAKYTFSEDAWRHIALWQRQNTDNLTEEGDFQKIGMFKKMEVYAAKFALILHTLFEFTGDPKTKIPTEIPLETTVYATVLADHLLGCGFQGLEEMNVDRDNIDNDAIKLLFNNLPDCFRTREAVEIGEGLKISPRSTNRYLKELMILGWIEKERHGYYDKVTSS